MKFHSTKTKLNFIWRLLTSISSKFAKVFLNIGLLETFIMIISCLIILSPPLDIQKHVICENKESFEISANCEYNFGSKYLHITLLPAFRYPIFRQKIVLP